MKKLIGFITVFTIVITVTAGNVVSKKKSFEVDTKDSKVYWTGKKVTGEHTGYLSLGSGEVFVDAGKVVGAHIIIDLNSMECTDLEGEWKDKLIGHLKSDDFFSVDKFPNSSFKITSIGGDGDQVVKGDLTIKGITHEISFPAKVTLKGDLVEASGTASIDRTKWDIKYGSGKFFSDLGDRMIRDEFEIRFDLVARSISN